MTYRNDRRERKLYRSRRDSILLGVCGGIAEHFDFSPWGVRLAFLLLMLFTWPFAIVGYFVLALVIKREPEQLVLSDEATAGEPVSSRAEALRRIHQRYESLEKRLERMESIVTSPGFEIDDELRKL